MPKVNFEALKKKKKPDEVSRQAFINNAASLSGLPKSRRCPRVGIHVRMSEELSELLEELARQTRKPKNNLYCEILAEGAERRLAKRVIAR